MEGKLIAVNDICTAKIGQAENKKGGTGCTVFLCEDVLYYFIELSSENWGIETNTVNRIICNFFTY